MFPSASRSTFIDIFGLFGAETDTSDQLDRYDFPSLTIFVKSVLGFLPWCRSNGVNFNPVCILNRITCSAGFRFTLSVRLTPSSKFVLIRFFNVCIALSTTPFPVCTRGVQYSISIFRFLQILGILWKQTLLFYQIWFFSGILYKLKLLDKMFVTSLLSALLHIFTVGHLLNLSTAISVCTSHVFSCSSPVKSICNSWPDSIRFSSFPKCFFGSWYLRFLPEAKQAVQSFTLFSMSCFIPDHQNMRASDIIFVVPEWPKRKMSRSLRFKSIGITIWSSTKTSPYLIDSLSNAAQ